MNLNTTLALLAPALVGGVITVVTVEDLGKVHEQASRRAAKVQELNESQLLLAARLRYQLDGGPADATEAELVARGYLAAEWLTRERVSTEPLTLPANPAATPSE